MDNNNALFELMTKMYSEMQEIKGEINSIKGEVNGIKGEVKNINTRLDNVEKEVVKTNVAIEQDIKPSISALLDGYKQNSEQITRVEKKLNEHDEIIIRRVK